MGASATRCRAPTEGLDRAEDACQEELREHDEREDLIRRTLAAQVGEDQHAERAAEEADDQRPPGAGQDRWPASCGTPMRHAHDHVASALRQRDQRLAHDLAESRSSSG